MLTHPDLSHVLGMSTAPQEDKPLLVRRLLEVLNRQRRVTGLPHRVVVDQARYFLTGSMTLSSSIASWEVTFS